MKLAILLFAIAAVLGGILLSYVLRDKNTPKGLAMTHGAIAAGGIVILLVYSLLYSPSPWPSLLLFIAAALGGFMLIYRDLTGKSLPKWMAIGHGSVAVIAFLLLVWFVFTIH